MHIILGDDFNATFKRMADRLAPDAAEPQKATDTAREAALRDIQKTLRGDKVHITEQRASGPMSNDTQFVVVPAQTIGDSGIDLYGVCLTDRAGVASLKEQGLVDEDAPVYDRLGTARSAAAALNMTESHDRFSTYMKDCAAQGMQAELALHDRLQAAPHQPATGPAGYAVKAAHPVSAI